MKWSVERLKHACIAPKVATYDCEPNSSAGYAAKLTNPEIFKFEAISIGDEGGQAFIVPLDESCKETAEYILRAIAAYTGE